VSAIRHKGKKKNENKTSQLLETGQMPSALGTAAEASRDIYDRLYRAAKTNIILIAGRPAPIQTKEFAEKKAAHVNRWPNQ
jgi:hypothetical protein